MIITPASIRPLNEVVSGCEFDIDATIYDSYIGSGENFRNIEPNPVSGASKTDYDLFLGATGSAGGDEPTFTGTAGDSGAYFSYDGGDFNLNQLGMPTFLNNIHKTTGGSDFTFVMAIYYINAIQAFISTKAASGSNQGIDVYSLSASSKIFMSQGNGSTNSTNTTVTNTLTASAWNLVGIAHSHSSNQTTMWINSATGEVLSHTFGTTTSSASATNFAFGGYGGGTFKLANTSRMKSLACFNRVLSDDEMTRVKKQLEIRHGQSYT